MTMTTNEQRLPAEWEPQGAVLIAWPHSGTDWDYMLDEVHECYRNMASAISRFAMLVVIGPDPEEIKRELDFIDPARLRVIAVETNGTWTRDYGAITTLDANGRPTLHDFCFNGWGLKFASCHDNLATRALVAKGILPRDGYDNRLGFVLEGGSIDSDGNGTLLTTSACL
ncbi:MAG: agmatine deiminase family protein, partial [Muribaculaceae bacterium]|nr:agmatine deiminase family protein [Muribaculaceae bacterium]